MNTKNREAQHQAEEPQLTQSESTVPLSWLLQGLQVKSISPWSQGGTPMGQWERISRSPYRSRALLPTGWCDSPCGARKKHLGIVQDLLWDI